MAAFAATWATGGDRQEHRTGASTTMPRQSMSHEEHEAHNAQTNRDPAAATSTGSMMHNLVRTISGRNQQVPTIKSDLHPTSETSSNDASGTTAAPSPELLDASEVDGRDPMMYLSEEERTARNDKKVHKLARQFTALSGLSGINPFDHENERDPRIDPSHPNFTARAYAESVLKYSRNDPNAVPMRQAGISFRNLNVHGFTGGNDYQKTVANAPLMIGAYARRLLGSKGTEVKILRDFDGLVRAGEMCVVLGPPGSGCTTFLKTVAGETHGFYVDDGSEINYQGISPKDMHSRYRGEAIYTAEVDVHFPQLTVGETLSFAAEARAARKPLGGLTRRQYADHSRDVIMAVFGISHTVNTRVGNDFIRGVSGGERKRVSIAEAALSQAPLQCWDNSTRGLDSANAIEFCKTLRTGTQLLGQTALVAIYQSPQAAYDCFDKVLVLYEGRQIYFGPCNEARKFFMDMGFEPPERQTTPDFLTSLTSPQERKAKQGFENRVPRTPDEFAAAWKASQTYKALLKDIDQYNTEYAIGGEAQQQFKASRRAQQAKGIRAKSPFTISYGQQIGLCLRRGFWRLKADPSLTITQLLGNVIMNLVISSVFFNLQPVTSSFFKRSSLLFFAILTNAFGAALEILTLYSQRPIIEKHARYALYHPSAEAWASMLTDLPYKIVNAITCNLVLYFMSNLRRTPGAFFFYILVAFLLQLCMSMIFRTIASASRTFTQAMTPTTVLMLGLIIFTGFALPVPYMLGWSRWINYLNPIAYGFEALMVNEFDGRFFTCDQFVPSGPGYTPQGTNFVCGAPTSVAGQTSISGTTYIAATYQYLDKNRWRNVGIIIAEMIFFLFTYMFFAEIVSAKKSKGEILVFRRGHVPKKRAHGNDVEAVAAAEKLDEKHKDTAQELHIQKQTAVFSWSDICYDIKIKSEERRILDHVDGWVKPGQLTALMGVSGAGKTTLLDVLATRVTMGVVSGDALVDGSPRDPSFQRKTGYVQQQDLHLDTATVRESLNFSALLRQPAHIPRAEKLAYVDEVIRLLDMEEYADAVVGVPGEGLNVEQRKRLTIGVELAAKPQLLLFLDEPTSGLDSQTSWAIADLMEKLTKETGQAILCTIHQPSALLFSRFDRLLFLARGGKTVYFGPVGENSHILIDYFQRNGGHDCPADANPAEWMLEVIGAAPGTHSDIDWHQTWRGSPEYKGVKEHLKELEDLKNKKVDNAQGDPNDKAAKRPFAASYVEQYKVVTRRIFQQYWRTPSYLWAKVFLVTAAGLFIGFSFFQSPLSQQGLQNQLFSIFMVFIIFSQLTQQIMPNFVVQRSLYEARERPSKAYSWTGFIFANVIAELPWAIILGAVLFFTWYYPIGYYRNAIQTDSVHLRGAMMFLFCWQFLLFASTFAHMCIAAIDTAETAGNMGNLLFSLALLFCGVLATPDSFPGFWIFMYRVSPFTYLVAGMISTGLANSNVVCSAVELVSFNPQGQQTCEQYMANYISSAGGYLANPTATSNCQFCTLADTNVFLASIRAPFSEAWRNFGIIWVFICFNIAATFFLYWLGRVPKKAKHDKKPKSKKE